MDVTAIHERFITGQRIVDIATDLGLSKEAVEYQIKKHRKLEPEKWPNRYVTKLANYYIQQFHVYECPECLLTFAVEQDYDNQSDVCCPVCWTDKINDLCSGGMKIKGR